MIPKSKSKFIKQLQVKKYRKQEQCFVVEGAKSVQELLRSDFEVVWLAATPPFVEANARLFQKKKVEHIAVDSDELAEVGSFQTNDGALAIARFRPNVPPRDKTGIKLVLDDIRDPGNLGTIIRTADWYGIRDIIASEETADIYNPKVVSATMGSFCRVQVFYTSLVEYLPQQKLPVYGTFLEGHHVHHLFFPESAFVVIGNEAHGISAPVAELVSQKITIPKWGDAESLNAGVATGIILDNLRRSQK